MKQKNVHVLHCTKLNSDGSITSETVERCLEVLSVARPNDVLIISGGVTRAGFPSEAAVARAYMEAGGLLQLPDIFLEEESTTTGENIKFTKKLMNRLSREYDFEVAFVVVYHRRSAILKTRILYSKLWPEAKCAFVRCQDNSSLGYRLIEYLVMIPLALIDPNEGGFLWKWFKRRRRNFQG